MSCYCTITTISIHAPARGATCPALWSPRIAKFQSTLPRGERQFTGRLLDMQMGFQSTLPRGERRPDSKRQRQSDDFNPRSREGSDQAIIDVENNVMISIHAPARGATAKPVHPCYPQRYFNPRSREGSDASCHQQSRNPQISIHAPARGAT